MELKIADTLQIVADVTGVVGRIRLAHAEKAI